MKTRFIVVIVLMLLACIFAWPVASTGSTLYGVDVSEWNGTINWTTLASSTNFAIIRSSWGCPNAGETVADYTDSSFAANQSGARSMGMLRGYYHYSYPQYNSPQNEATQFLNAVGSLQTGEILCLDFEENYSDPVNWCKQFLDSVRSATGRSPLLYINYGNVLAQDWSPVINAGYPLWLADWDDITTPGTPSTPWSPAWTIKQYTSDGTMSGIPSARVDLDVFDGDSSQFQALAGINGISGTVVNSQSAPISGATVTTSSGATTTTAANGTYTLYTIPGTYYVTASKTGYNPVVNTNVVVTAGSPTTSNFSLPTTNTSNDAGLGTDAGNTFAAASVVSTGAYTGYANVSTDANDYYKFSVTSGQYITCTMTPQAGSDCDIYLYDPSGTLKASSNASGSATETVAYTAASTGNWAIRVNAYAASGQYSFNIATFNTTAPSGSNLSLSGTATTDTYLDGSHTGAKAIDGINTSASKWISLSTADPNWLAVDLGSSQTINGFVVKLPGSEGESSTYNAKSFKIQSGLSPIGPWTDEASVDNTAQANIITRNYISPKSMRYVRLQVILSGIDTTTRIPEFEIWGGSCTNPTITTQPSNSTICSGSNATFSVTATNATGYQWRKASVNISGATTSSYTKTGATTADAGSYDCVVSNACGNVTSNTATLTVNPLPTITTQPASRTITLGQGVTFNVTATGATSYQWKKGGSNISGATQSSYMIASVAITDAGNFTCAVTNSCGTVTSSTAVLSVTVMNSNTPTGTNRAPASTTVNVDTYYGAGFEGNKVIDSSLTTKWCTTGVAPPHWIALDLGQNRTVNGFVVKLAGAGGEYTTMNAKNFQIQSASSLSGPWYNECTVDNTAQANIVSRSYSIAQTLRYVRLYITNAGIDNYSRVYEFEVWAQ